MVIDFLEATIAERDEQRRRYMLAYREALKLGGLVADEQEAFDRIKQEVDALRQECAKKENELEPLRVTEHDEYVGQMVELCDYEAKKFVVLTGKLLTLIREIGLRRASKTLSNLPKKK